MKCVYDQQKWRPRVEAVSYEKKIPLRRSLKCSKSLTFNTFLSAFNLLKGNFDLNLVTFKAIKCLMRCYRKLYKETHGQNGVINMVKMKH